MDGFSATITTNFPYTAMVPPSLWCVCVCVAGEVWMAAFCSTSGKK